jgi:hypothetical protein
MKSEGQFARQILALSATLIGVVVIDCVPNAFAESTALADSAVTTATAETKLTPASAAVSLGAWSQGESPQPTKREWTEESTELTVRFPNSVRSHGTVATRCQAHVMREWLKVRCKDHRTAAIQLVGGEAKNVYYSIDAASEKTSGMPGEGEVVLAVREGSSRVIQWWTFGPGYDGPLTVIGSMLLQQEWVAGEALPSFVLSDVLHEPIRTATQEGK